MTYPSISLELDRAGLGVVAFRVLAHVARRVEGRSTVVVQLPDVAATCQIDAPRAKHALRELSAFGFVRVAFAGQTAQITLAEVVRDGLSVPAWLDLAGLSAPAVRVIYHYAQQHDAKHSAWDVGVACRLPPETVRAAEVELIERGMLERQSGRRFVLTLPAEATATAQARGAALM